ncbi:sulfatase-like hydrolase/transferase [Termitidicoccus mucosus]|uniref:Sulfatase n=1 Tax=Termitidicoccus mucosus TaxID=1184151 RepID=A0A178ILL7_9BACT|nr:sulfatase [Opitutaceae bacterium TSB47]
MKKSPAAVLALAATAAAASAAPGDAPLPPPRPNIIFILADDLGYGDLGSFFQNARRDSGDRAAPWHATPKLDRMAAGGARLTHHYCAAPVCAPSRASFLSGRSQGHANVRDNQFDKALDANHTVGTILQRAGYATAAIGKWGLQGDGEAPGWPAHPLNRGFDYYYGCIRHIDGHEHYPKEQPRFAKKAAARGPVRLWENHADVTAALDKCYTTDLYTARAKRWIVDHKKSAPGKPFFIYLAYDTPHAVLELPAQPYPDGGGLRGGVQWLGTPGRMINTALGEPDSWTHPDYANATYDHDRNPATPEIPWPEVNKRHATSVRRIDDAVGDLLQTLDDLGIAQSTLVVFTSDNGPAAESYLEDEYTPEFFSSFGPFDGLKRDTLEGGLRVPAIALWPGRIAAGRELAAPCAMWDWLPTFANLAGLPPPANTDGVSLVPALVGGGENDARQRSPYLYFEYNYKGRTPPYTTFEPGRRGRFRGQMQAIRLGDLMALRYDIKDARDDFEIYDVAHDPKQTRDLSLDPARAALQAHFKMLALQSRRPDSSAPRPYDDALVPALDPPPVNLAPGLAWRCFEGAFPWVPDATALKTARAGRAAVPDSAPLPRGRAAALEFHGYLRAPAGGEYTFALDTDAGAVLRLHHATLIDADFGHAPGAEKTASARLQAGLHPFTLTCRADGGDEPRLALRWHGPGFDWQPIPADAFSSAPEE